MPKDDWTQSEKRAPLIAVVSALARAVAQLPEAEMRRPLLLSIGWTLLAFAAVWVGVAILLDSLLTSNPIAEWAGRILGILAAPILTFFLFPFVATGVAGMYADRIAGTVEARSYPFLPPPPATRWGDQIRSVLNLMGLGILLNLAIFPLYLILPGANLVLFLGMNGYLLGRGYFDLAALRRVDWKLARKIWRDCRLEFWLLGVAVAFLFEAPFLGLLSPLIGTAASVHLLARSFANVGAPSGAVAAATENVSL